MRLYAPRMHARYGLTLDTLIQRDARVRRNFLNNNFAAMTINLGPRTVTYRHTDHLNVPWGWCAISAFGRYDYKLGGGSLMDMGGMSKTLQRKELTCGSVSTLVRARIGWLGPHHRLRNRDTS